MPDALPDPIRQTDVLDPARANALLASLGRQADLVVGDALPPFFHQVYFWTALPPVQLGRDGHPQRGTGVVPDMGFPRRMWAGGRLTFHKSLRVGVRATCEATCLRAARKQGRSGPLAVVTLRHDYHQDGALCVSEERDLIYRADPDLDAPSARPPQAPRTADGATQLSFSTTLLFRYSALTFNGHRIHYDLDYAKGVEGYAGLVVHGPLLAQLLMLKAVEELGPIARFSFRATAPLMHFEGAVACREGTRLWIAGPEGRLCMQADVTVG